jgi:integrase
LSGGTLFLPDPKSRRPTLLPLPTQALYVVRRRWNDAAILRQAGADGFVFSYEGMSAIGVKTLGRWLERTSTELGARWSPHDLRRGYLSAAAALAPAYVVKRLAHHATVSADVTDGYISLGVEELRPWAQRTADKVILGSGSVVALVSDHAPAIHGAGAGVEP